MYCKVIKLEASLAVELSSFDVILKVSGFKCKSKFSRLNCFEKNSSRSSPITIV